MSVCEQGMAPEPHIVPMIHKYNVRNHQGSPSAHYIDERALEWERQIQIQIQSMQCKCITSDDLG
jgi:hypothetical protein